MARSAQPTFPEFNIPPDDSEEVVNVASVPHRSPFRYPGGKTWLIPHIRQWLTYLTPKSSTLGEPFAGGAIIGLSGSFVEYEKGIAK